MKKQDEAAVEESIAEIGLPDRSTCQLDQEQGSKAPPRGPEKPTPVQAARVVVLAFDRVWAGHPLKVNGPRGDQGFVPGCYYPATPLPVKRKIAVGLEGAHELLRTCTR